MDYSILGVDIGVPLYWGNYHIILPEAAAGSTSGFLSALVCGHMTKEAASLAGSSPSTELSLARLVLCCRSEETVILQAPLVEECCDAAASFRGKKASFQLRHCFPSEAQEPRSTSQHCHLREGYSNQCFNNHATELQNV